MNTLTKCDNILGELSLFIVILENKRCINIMLRKS